MLFFLIFWGVGSLFAQNTGVKSFTLEQAVAYAQVHNYGVINAGKDLEAAKQKLRESIAEGLPQVDASIDAHDNVSRPVFIFPGDLAGKPGQEVAVQFGTKYDAGLSARLSQLIFDGRYFIGLKAARVSLEKSDKSFFKNKLAVKEQVANAYYQVLAVGESLHVVDSTLAVTRKLAAETRHIYEAGMTEDIDVDQMNLLVANLEASHTFLKNQYGIAVAYFKFYLGLDEKDSVTLVQTLPALIHQKQHELAKIGGFNLSQNIDFQLANTAEKLLNLQLKVAKAAYIPSITANLSYQTQAQRDEWNFFGPGKWYQSSVLGVSMKIPILSSGKRLAQVKQARIALEQAQVRQKQTASQLNLQYKNSLNDYKNAVRVYKNKEENRKIAEKIYRKTTEKYKQGMASSLDLLNTHNQFLNVENDFISAGLNLLKSAENLQTLLTKAN